MSAKKMSSPAAWQPPTTIWNRMFFSIFFANMAFNLAQNMCNPLLSKYADLLGAPESQIGILMSMFAVTSLIFRFVAGPAMDSFNRKFILIGAMGLIIVSYLGYSVATAIGSMFVFRLVQGMGSSFGNVCCLTMVSDTLPKDKLNSGIGYYSCAAVVAQAIGPSIGLWLVDLVGYRATYQINVGVMAVAILATALIQLPPREYKKFNMQLKNIIAKEAIVPGLVILFVAMGFTTINSFLVVYAGKQGVEGNIGIFFTVYALTLVFTRPMIGKLTDKYGFCKVAIPAICMTTCSLVVIGFSDKLWMFIAAAFINAFGYGAVQPALQSLAIKSVPANRRGSASSTNYIFTDAATIIGPAIAGVIAEKINYSAMWFAMAAPTIISAFIVVVFRSKIGQIEENFRQRQANS